MFWPNSVIELITLMFITDAFDNELMYQTLKDIVEGSVVEVPTYDFVTHSRWEGNIPSRPSVTELEIPFLNSDRRDKKCPHSTEPR